VITKVIFLDIDGVLNSVQSAHMYHRLRGKKVNPYDDFCLTAVCLLCDILDAHPDCKLVISSSWRKRYCDDLDASNDINLKSIFDPLPDENIKQLIQSRVIGRTKAIYKEIPQGIKVSNREVFRGDEIQEWIDTNKDRLAKDFKFVILDDESDMGYLYNHHVQTDTHVGLTIRNSQEVILRLMPVQKEQEERILEATKLIYRESINLRCHDEIVKLIDSIRKIIKT